LANSVEREPTVKYALVALDAILGIAVLVLIFLHSGKDAGLSTTFGGGGAFGGSQVVQKNLDRITVGCAVAFFVVSIALVYII
jgi:preprotein translocase subunit SecG